MAALWSSVQGNWYLSCTAATWDRGPRPTMSVRIGYVNVQGLAPDRVSDLLPSLGHHLRFPVRGWDLVCRSPAAKARIRRFTPRRPRRRISKGRPTGGIYLPEPSVPVQRWLANQPRPCIPITLQTSTVSAYLGSTSLRTPCPRARSRPISNLCTLPPLSSAISAIALPECRGPGWCSRSSRSPPYPSRAVAEHHRPLPSALLTDSCAELSLIVSSVADLRPKLGLDHCFVTKQLAVRQARLRLLDCARIPLRTDHTYACMHLTVATKGPARSSSSRHTIPTDPIRYHLHPTQGLAGQPDPSRREESHPRCSSSHEMMLMSWMPCWSGSARTWLKRSAARTCRPSRWSRPRSSHPAPSSREQPAPLAASLQGGHAHLRGQWPHLPTSDAVDPMTENLDLLRRKYTAPDTANDTSDANDADATNSCTSPRLLTVPDVEDPCRSPDPLGLQMSQGEAHTDHIPGTPVNPRSAGPGDQVSDRDKHWMLGDVFCGREDSRRDWCPAGREELRRRWHPFACWRPSSTPSSSRCWPRSLPSVLRTGRTPAAWNRSTSTCSARTPPSGAMPTTRGPSPSSACSARSSSACCSTFDETGWARVHPCRAGFRGGYSVLTNAAIVHPCWRRGGRTRSSSWTCEPHSTPSITRSSSRPWWIGAVPPPFAGWSRHSPSRMSGPSSWSTMPSRSPFDGPKVSFKARPLPELFNIFIDDLRSILNADAADFPSCPLLCGWWGAASEVWRKPKAAGPGRGVGQEEPASISTSRWRAVISARRMAPWSCRGRSVPVVECYTYLGFPVTIPRHRLCGPLDRRLEGRREGHTNFLTVSSEKLGRGQSPACLPCLPGTPCSSTEPRWSSAGVGPRRHPSAVHHRLRPVEKLLTWINGGSQSCSRSPPTCSAWHRRTSPIPAAADPVPVGHRGRSPPTIPCVRSVSRVGRASKSPAWVFARTLKRDKTFDEFRRQAAPDQDLKTQLPHLSCSPCVAMSSPRRPVAPRWPASFPWNYGRSRLARCWHRPGRSHQGPEDAAGLPTESLWRTQKMPPCGSLFLRTHGDLLPPAPSRCGWRRLNEKKRWEMFAHLFDPQGPLRSPMWITCSTRAAWPEAIAVPDRDQHQAGRGLPRGAVVVDADVFDCLRPTSTFDSTYLRWIHRGHQMIPMWV